MYLMRPCHNEPLVHWTFIGQPPNLLCYHTRSRVILAREIAVLAHFRGEKQVHVESGDNPVNFVRANTGWPKNNGTAYFR